MKKPEGEAMSAAKPEPAATTAPEAAQAATPAPAVTPEAPAVTANVGNSVGDLAPDFALASVGGGEVTLADYDGKPLVIYFFTTW